jgi:hypothetical protein
LEIGCVADANPHCIMQKARHLRREIAFLDGLMWSQYAVNLLLRGQEQSVRRWWVSREMDLPLWLYSIRMSA